MKIYEVRFMNDSFEKKKKRLASLENGRGVKFLLNEGYKILENPIVMFDTSYNLLACTEGIVTDDRLWNEITTLGLFSHETVKFFYTEGFIDTYAQTDTVALMKSDKLKYDRANGILFDKDGIQLGNINVTACLKSFEEGDMELIGILSELLSVELQNSKFYQQIDRIYQESMLNDLLEGNIRNSVIEKEQLAELYDELKPNLYLAVVDITQCEHTLTHLAYFRDLLRKIQADYRYYIHSNYIVIIISTDNNLLSVKKDLSKLNAFFAEHKIYAGISSRFQDLLELQKYYREAINALNYGLVGKKNQQIFRYDNIKIEHFLNSVKDTVDISEVISPIISLIQEYDRENNTSLLELLNTYLSYGMDTELTCEIMKITPDELPLILKKLEDTFEIDWKDGDLLLNIFVTIKMIDSLQS